MSNFFYQLVFFLLYVCYLNHFSSMQIISSFYPLLIFSFRVWCINLASGALVLLLLLRISFSICFVNSCHSVFVFVYLRCSVFFCSLTLSLSRSVVIIRCVGTASKLVKLTFCFSSFRKCYVCVCASVLLFFALRFASFPHYRCCCIH